MLGQIECRMFAIVMVIATLVVACGGPAALTEEDRNLAARMREQVSLGSEAAPVTNDETDCLAKAAVADLGGASRLESEYQITRSAITGGLDPWAVTFSSDDAEKLAEATFRCVDMRRLVKDRLVASGFAAAGAGCVSEAVSLDLLKDQAAVGFGSTGAGGATLEADIDADFAAAAQSCGVSP